MSVLLITSCVLSPVVHLDHRHPLTLALGQAEGRGFESTLKPALGKKLCRLWSSSNRGASVAFFLRSVRLEVDLTPNTFVMLAVKVMGPSGINLSRLKGTLSTCLSLLRLRERVCVCIV